MKITVALHFRGLKSQVVPLLPPDLSFIASSLEESDYRRYPTSGNVTVSPEIADRIVNWGSQDYRGKSIVRAARLYEAYGLEDLTDEPVVEVFRPAGGADRRAVKNFKKAYRATWACEFCHRVSWEQRSPLDVGVRGKREIILTRTDEWIVSARVREALEGFGVATRALENTDAYFQASLGPECPVVPDPDRMWIHEPCPGCGHRAYARKDWVRGDLLRESFPEITVFRHEPLLTVPADAASEIAFSKGDIRFSGTGGWADRPVHVVGSVANVHELHFTSQAGGYPCYFARTDLVRELLERNVSGFEFRPVRMG